MLKTPDVGSACNIQLVSMLATQPDYKLRELCETLLQDICIEVITREFFNTITHMQTFRRPRTSPESGRSFTSYIAVQPEAAMTVGWRPCNPLPEKREPSGRSRLPRGRTPRQRERRPSTVAVESDGGATFPAPIARSPPLDQNTGWRYFPALKQPRSCLRQAVALVASPPPGCCPNIRAQRRSYSLGPEDAESDKKVRAPGSWLISVSKSAKSILPLTSTS